MLFRSSARSHQCLRSLPRPLGLGAREDRLPQPTESAAPTPLRPRHPQVTSYKFHFQLGAPSGLHYSQAAWVRPCGVYLFYFMFLAYSAGGAPRAALSPSRSGQTQWHVPLLHLSWGRVFDPSCLLFGAGSWYLFLFLDVASLRVKGRVPEHRDSGLLPALRPSPSGLVHGIATWHASDG